MRRQDATQQLCAASREFHHNQCRAWSSREKNGKLIGKSEGRVGNNTKDTHDRTGSRLGHRWQSNTQERGKDNNINWSKRREKLQKRLSTAAFRGQHQDSERVPETKTREQGRTPKIFLRELTQRVMETRMRARALEETLTTEDKDRERKGKSAVKVEDVAEILEIYDDSEEDNDRQAAEKKQGRSRGDGGNEQSKLK